jgi:RNA polymerase-binding transcription factor DksA
MPGKKLSPKDLELFSDQLRRMLGVLRGDMEHLAADAQVGQPRSDTQGDDGNAYYADFSMELMERDGQAVQKVVEAIGRIKEGKFGRCMECEQWLMKDRLRAMPHARLCIECQRQAEVGGI